MAGENPSAPEVFERTVRSLSRERGCPGFMTISEFRQEVAVGITMTVAFIHRVGASDGIEVAQPIEHILVAGDIGILVRTRVGLIR